MNARLRILPPAVRELAVTMLDASARERGVSRLTIRVADDDGHTDLMRLHDERRLPQPVYVGGRTAL